MFSRFLLWCTVGQTQLKGPSRDHRPGQEKCRLLIQLWPFFCCSLLSQNPGQPRRPSSGGIIPHDIMLGSHPLCARRVGRERESLAHAAGTIGFVFGGFICKNTAQLRCVSFVAERERPDGDRLSVGQRQRQGVGVGVGVVRHAIWNESRHGYCILCEDRLILDCVTDVKHIIVL